jgi:hypothetical protein
LPIQCALVFQIIFAYQKSLPIYIPLQLRLALALASSSTILQHLLSRLFCQLLIFPNRAIQTISDKFIKMSTPNKTPNANQNVAHNSNPDDIPRASYVVTSLKGTRARKGPEKPIQGALGKGNPPVPRTAAALAEAAAAAAPVLPAPIATVSNWLGNSNICC